MRILKIQEDAAEYCQLVARQKKKLDDWQFLHITVQDPEKKVTLGEVEQFLEFNVQMPDASLLVIDKTDELLLFAPKDKGLVLKKFEKSVYENFSSNVLRARVRSLDVEGLEQFSKIIEPHISSDNIKAYVSFRRMSRVANCLFVLDDDPMVLKQLEKVLAGFGSVFTLKDANDLTVSYIQYAPDILFLDIHLGKEKGNELLKKLKSEVDPYAHVVMISSDSNKSIVLDIKEGGANGFVVKPFDRNRLYKEIMKAPTVATKT